MPLADLLARQGFRTGLAVGAVAFFSVVALIVVRQRPGRGRRELLPVAGIALVAAAVVGLDRAGPEILLSGRLVAGLALLAVGPFMATRALGRVRSSWWIGPLAAIPGAAIVAGAASLENSTGWVPPLVFVATVAGGALVADFDRVNARAGLGPVLVAVTAVAIYTTLPDTEQIAIVMGAALPIAMLGTPVAVAALGPGAFSTVGLLCWVAAVGGRGRPGSVIGAIACLGLMLVEPLVRRALRGRGREPRRPLSPRAMLAIVLHAGTVAATSRVAGLETSGATAVAISLLVLAGGGAVLAALLAPWGRTDHAPTTGR